MVNYHVVFSLISATVGLFKLKTFPTELNRFSSVVQFYMFKGNVENTSLRSQSLILLLL